MWKSSQLWRCLKHILCTKFRFILLLNIGFVRNLVHICQLWSTSDFPMTSLCAWGTNVEMIRGWKLWMECVKILLTFICATSNFTRLIGISRMTSVVTRWKFQAGRPFGRWSALTLSCPLFQKIVGWFLRPPLFLSLYFNQVVLNICRAVGMFWFGLSVKSFRSALKLVFV